MIRKQKTTTFSYKHAIGSAPVELHEFVLEKGISWENAKLKYYEEIRDDREGFYISLQNTNNKPYVILLLRVKINGKEGPIPKYIIYRPNSGQQKKRVYYANIVKKYQKVCPSFRDLHQ